MSTKTIEHLTNLVQTFCDKRDWQQFHTPKDLAIGVITESSELLEHFRFLSNEQAEALLQNRAKREEIEDEVADILFFLLRFAQMNEINLTNALERKITKLDAKYPIEKSRGKNLKYTDL